MRNPAPWPSPVQPAGPLPPDQPRRSGIKWKFVIVAGMAGGLLVIGALLALNSLSKGWNQGGAFGVPQDFPIYPSATLSGVKETVSTSGTRVTATWEADAPLDTVTAYYAERLDRGSWQITGTNAVDGTWEFRRTDGKIHGYIQLSGHGQQTRVDILLLK